jgi:hypothetical protein
MNPNILIRRLVRTNNIKLNETKEVKTVNEIDIEISDKSIQINDIVEDTLKANIVI